MPDYSIHQFLKVEVNPDKIAVVTLNRPESLNAFAVGMHQEVEHVFDELSNDQDIKVIVVTGAGRAFSAGADVRNQDKRATTFTAADQIALFRTAPRIKLIQKMLDVRQPMIAAVNGPAAGLGATVALFCDIVIASEKARFGDTHVRSGMLPGDGGCVIWPMLLGTPKAKELLWTGDLISGVEAKELGLVSYVVPHEELMPKAMALATRLAKGPSVVIEFTKRALNKRIRNDTNLILELSDALQGLTYFTEDFKEGPRAFLEKRPPNFQGR